MRTWQTLLYGVVIAAGLETAVIAATDVATDSATLETNSSSNISLAIDVWTPRLMDALEKCELPLGAATQLDRWDKLRPKLIRLKVTGRDYPIEERLLGKQAVLQTEFLVDAGGNVRFIHVAHSFPLSPDQQFVDAAIEVARRGIYQPSKIDDQATASWAEMPIKFVIAVPDHPGPMGELLRQDKWEALLTRADGGDVPSIRLSAYVAELVRSETGLNEAGALSLLVDSALHGDEFARFDLLRRLATCHQSSLVDAWVFASANAGSQEAQLWWAERLIRSGDEAFYAKAGELFHDAIRSSDPFVRLWVAGLLATAPIDRLRDPVLAIEVATALNDKPGPAHTRDPDYPELLAAAEAANGRYSEAVHAELKAIDFANRLRWNTSRLQARLASYQAEQPWHGYLCDCEKLVPGEY